MGVDVYRHADALEQFGKALELETHHRPAHVVGVVVRGKYARQVHAVGLEGIDQIVCGVGRIDHQAIARLPVADQIGEVAHLLGDHVVGREVAAGEQLPEVQPVIIFYGRHAPRLKRLTTAWSSARCRRGWQTLRSPSTCTIVGLRNVLADVKEDGTRDDTRRLVSRPRKLRWPTLLEWRRVDGSP